jgi:transcriptional antiterminator RfaH
MTAVDDLHPAWFCLRSQPKHEHIAAAHLRQTNHIEVFLPRIRFKRATRQGPKWVTEALFPGYLFAWFDLQTTLRQTQHIRGVRGVVHFGQLWPTIPGEIIDDLRRLIGSSEPRVIEENFSPGDAVQIADGTFRGLHAVVSRVMTTRDRVAVLMEFLGRQTMIEVSANSLIREVGGRAAIYNRED